MGRRRLKLVEETPSLRDWGHRAVREVLRDLSVGLVEHPSGLLASLPGGWSPEAWAEVVGAAVMHALGVRLPIGIGPSRFVSRVAARCASGGALIVTDGDEARFLRPMPLETLPTLRRGRGRVLREMGLSTVGDVARLPLEALTGGLGRVGIDVYREARGLDGVRNQAGGSGLWVTRRFAPPTNGLSRVEKILAASTEAALLQMGERGETPGRVRLILWRADRRREEGAGTVGPGSTAERTVLLLARRLLSRLARDRRALKALALGFDHLVPAEQTDLGLGLGPSDPRVSDAVRSVRRRFGQEAIRKAGAAEYASAASARRWAPATRG
jgi:DNA polymerase-4